MPKTKAQDKPKKKRKGYTFAQLSAKAKEEARNWFRETDDLSDHLAELLANDLEDHFGLTNCKIWFSLGNCQGDGVCFEGSPDLSGWADHDEGLKAMLAELEALAGLMNFETPEFVVRIDHTDRYCHSYSMSLEFEWYNHPWPDDPLESWQWVVVGKVGALEKYLEERIIAIAKELEKIGYAEIEYRESDEYIEENMEDNDYRFTRDGEIV